MSVELKPVKQRKWQQWGSNGGESKFIWEVFSGLFSCFSVSWPVAEHSIVQLLSAGSKAILFSARNVWPAAFVICPLTHLFGSVRNNALPIFCHTLFMQTCDSVSFYNCSNNHNHGKLKRFHFPQVSSRLAGVTLISFLSDVQYVSCKKGTESLLMQMLLKVLRNVWLWVLAAHQDKKKTLNLLRAVNK